MTAASVLTIVLLLAAIAACAALIWASLEAVSALRSFGRLSDDVHERVLPVLEKADVMVDAANAELWRVDGAITRFEEASMRVSNASATLSEVVQAPAELVTGVAERVRRAWKDRKRGSDHSGETEQPDEAPEQCEETEMVHASEESGPED